MAEHTHVVRMSLAGHLHLQRVGARSALCGRPVDHLDMRASMWKTEREQFKCQTCARIVSKDSAAVIGPE